MELHFSWKNLEPSLCLCVTGELCTRLILFVCAMHSSHGKDITRPNGSLPLFPVEPSMLPTPSRGFIRTPKKKTTGFLKRNFVLLMVQVATRLMQFSLFDPPFLFWLRRLTMERGKKRREKIAAIPESGFSGEVDPPLQLILIEWPWRIFCLIWNLARNDG